MNRNLAHGEIDSVRAWLMAALAFLTCFVVFGVVYSFGAFFKPMAAEFGADRASTSAVFAITACIYNLLGVAGGHLADRYGPRPVIVAGAAAIGTGLMLTSVSERLWLVYLTYGLGVGAGVALTYVPMLAVVGGWFGRWRNTALGIAVSGIGCGTLLVAPLAALLIERYGWRHADLVIGAGAFIALALCGVFSKAPPVTITTGRLRLARAVRTPNFLALYGSSILASIAIYMPFVYLPDFAHHQGINQVAAASLVGFVGAASIIGRLGLGITGDRTGIRIIRLYKAATLALGLSYALWMLAHSYALLIVFTLTMGVSYGGMVALSPAVLAELFGVEGLGTMLGALYTSSAISSLSGPPLEGLLIDQTGSYIWAAAFAGGCGVLAFVMLLPLGRSPAPAAELGKLGPVEGS